MRNILYILCLISTCTICCATEWHHPLYLGNGGYWHKRIEVEIRNEMEREAMGEPVELRVGKRAGEADLAGFRADAVRLCDAKGTEMLFRITGPNGQMIKKGIIPDGSNITIPVECRAKDTTTYYLYFDNSEAWNVPDFLESHVGIVNGGVEEGEDGILFGWTHDVGDEKHNALWVTENPHSGSRCLKTIVSENAEPTWVSTRQRDIYIIGGARYVMKAWVKAENVKGYAGWYIHVGNEDDFMMISPMLEAGGGSYDWKMVTAEFTAPEEANRADLGTVLRGTGTAWFDDVSLKCKDSSMLSANSAKPEKLEVQEIGSDVNWYDDNSEDDVYWDYRIPVKVMNLSEQSLDSSLVYVDLSTLFSRLDKNTNKDSIRITYKAKAVPHYQLEETLLFEGRIPAKTICTYYLYFSTDERIQSTSDSYSDLLKSKRNLVNNPTFEQGEVLPEGWSGTAEEGTLVNRTMGFDEPGLFGKRCAKVYVPYDAEKVWTGWRQNVPVEPNKTYFYGAWLKCKDIENGSVRLHAHYRNADGELCEDKQHTSAGKNVSGTVEWTFMSGMFDMPEDIAFFQLHLTMLANGTVWHDGVVLAEVVNGMTGKPQIRKERSLPVLEMWQVNAIVKLFQDDLPSQIDSSARISAARNEKEPLQIAVRSSKELGLVNIEVEPLVNEKGDKLNDLDVGVVGYVPIDHKTNYYSSESPKWHRKYPTSSGACDGWAGMWPDPILPQNTFDLTADKTQPVWITVSVPKKAVAGDYVGRVKLVCQDKVLKEMPFVVHVWDFTLPDENHVGAIYDLRLVLQCHHF